MSSVTLTFSSMTFSQVDVSCITVSGVGEVGENYSLNWTVISVTSLQVNVNGAGEQTHGGGGGATKVGREVQKLRPLVSLVPLHRGQQIVVEHHTNLLSCYIHIKFYFNGASMRSVCHRHQRSNTIPIECQEIIVHMGAKDPIKSDDNY